MGEADERLQAGTDYPVLGYSGRYFVTFSRVLVLAACILAAVLAVLTLLTDTSLSVIEALGWVFVVLAVYLASLLVP